MPGDAVPLFDGAPLEPPRSNPLGASILAGRNRARWSAGVFVSIAAHVSMFGGALLYARLTPPRTVMEQPIMAHLVRLGAPPDPKLLPRLPAPTQQPSGHESVPKNAKESDADASARAVERSKEILQRQKRLAEALTRLGAPTEGLTSPKGEAPVGEADGDPSGSADHAKEGDKYAALLQEALLKNWVLPTTIPEKTLLFLFCNIRLFISGDGKITHFKIETASGNDDYDRAVKAAVDHTSELPVPPPALASDYASTGLLVHFKP